MIPQLFLAAVNVYGHLAAPAQGRHLPEALRLPGQKHKVQPRMLQGLIAPGQIHQPVLLHLGLGHGPGHGGQQQAEIHGLQLGDAFRFITENTVCKVLSYKGSVFGLECPNFMDLEVTETEPGLAGNTATNTLKPATVETGAEVKVPLFINIGDKITIDTRTGEYIGRTK